MKISDKSLQRSKDMLEKCIKEPNHEMKEALTKDFMDDLESVIKGTKIYPLSNKSCDILDKFDSVIEKSKIEISKPGGTAKGIPTALTLSLIHI